MTRSNWIDEACWQGESSWGAWVWFVWSIVHLEVLLIAFLLSGPRRFYESVPRRTTTVSFAGQMLRYLTLVVVPETAATEITAKPTRQKKAKFQIKKLDESSLRVNCFRNLSKHIRVCDLQSPSDKPCLHLHVNSFQRCPTGLTWFYSTLHVAHFLWRFSIFL